MLPPPPHLSSFIQWCLSSWLGPSSSSRLFGYLGLPFFFFSPNAFHIRWPGCQLLNLVESFLLTYKMGIIKMLCIRLLWGWNGNAWTWGLVAGTGVCSLPCCIPRYLPSSCRTSAVLSVRPTASMPSSFFLLCWSFLFPDTSATTV